MSIISIPLTAAVMVPDRTAIIDRQDRYTYAEFMERVSFLAGGLEKYGCRKGWRCGFLGPSSHQAVELYYALSGLSGIFVPLDPRLSAGALERRVNALGLDALVVSRAGLPAVELLRSREQIPTVSLLVALDFQRKGYVPYGQLLAEKRFHRFLEQGTGDEINVILYTAGRSGPPRGVAISSNGILENLDSNFSFQVHGKKYQDDPVSLLSMPLYHLAGFLGMLGTIYKANTLVLREWDGPGNWYQAMANCEVSTSVLTPRMLQEILNCEESDRLPLPSLRAIWYEWDMTSESIMHRTSDLFPGVEFFHAYGTTDTANANLLVLPMSECTAGKDPQPLRVNSCGRTSTDLLQVVDRRGAVVTGQIGEIMVRPSSGVLGYYEPDGAFVPFTQRWLNTNDLGYVDEDGYVYIIGYKLSQNYLHSHGIEGSVEIIPSIYSKRMVENSSDGAALDQNGIRSLFQFFCRISECKTLQELRECYLSSIGQLFPADLYGISLTGVESGVESIRQDQKDGFILQWIAPELKKLSFYTRAGDSARLDRQEVTLQDDRISARGMMKLLGNQDVVHVLCVPLYSDMLHQVGMLMFAGKDPNVRFSSRERTLVRLIAGNLCSAQISILRLWEQRRQNDLEEIALSFLGHGVLVSNLEGEILYINPVARAILADAARETSSQILETLACHLNHFAKDDICFSKTSVNYFSKGSGEINARVLMVKTLGSRGRPEVVTTLDWLDRKPEFSHFLSAMSGRRAEFVNLLMEGMSKAKIAETMSISVNTVNYHLKQLLAQFGCSSQAELIAKLYSLFYATD